MTSLFHSWMNRNNLLLETFSKCSHFDTMVIALASNIALNSRNKALGENYCKSQENNYNVNFCRCLPKSSLNLFTTCRSLWWFAEKTMTMFLLFPSSSSINLRVQKKGQNKKIAKLLDEKLSNHSSGHLIYLADVFRIEQKKVKWWCSVNRKNFHFLTFLNV